MYIIILFILFILMTIGMFLKLKKEVTQPAIIFLTVYTFSIGCAVLNIQKWGIDMKLNTFLILLLGAVEFIIITYIVNKVYEKKYKNLVQYDNNYNQCGIEKKYSFYVFSFIIYDLVVLFILIYNIRQISSMFGEYNSVSQMLHLFREHTSYNNHARLPGYVTLLMKPVIASVYVFSFIFLKNLVNSMENIKLVIYKTWYYLIPALIHMINCYMQSNREGIIILLLNLITMGIVLWAVKEKWQKEIKVRSIFKFGVFGLIGLIIFYFSAAWVGRVNTKGMFEYITFYAGGSIECLNQYVQDPEPVTVVRGEETFYNLINNLDSAGITNFDLREKKVGHLEFRYHNDVMVGNVYTAYRRWLHDFGIVGVFMLQGIMALIMQVIYNQMKYTSKSRIKKDLLILMYSYLSYTIFMHPIGDYFYFDILSKASIAVIVSIIMLYILINYLNIDITNKKISINIKGDK